MPPWHEDDPPIADSIVPRVSTIVPKDELDAWAKRLAAATKDSGHGGMDGLMIYRIIECLQQGLALDQNIYEGCFWSAVSPLSEASVAQGGAPQQFPDFTRGNWIETEPLAVVN